MEECFNNYNNKESRKGVGEGEDTLCIQCIAESCKVLHSASSRNSKIKNRKKQGEERGCALHIQALPQNVKP